jgi:hypothetical protein
LANKDTYCPSRGVPEPRLVPSGEGMVHTIYPRRRREFVPRGDPLHSEGGRRVGFGPGEVCWTFLCSWPIPVWGNDRSFRSQRSQDHDLSFVVRVVLQGGRVGVPPRRDRMDFANPTFEQMARHWFDSFCTNPSAESFAHSRSRFFILQVGGVDGVFLYTKHVH